MSPERKSIFEFPPDKFYLDTQQVLKSIPQPHHHKERPHLAKVAVEFRCRMIKIRSKNYLELSMKKPNEKRKYLTYEDQWITDCIIPKKYDKYVTKTIYSYTKE